MMLQQSSFCNIPSSHFPSVFNHTLKQRNPVLPQQQFSFHFPRKGKVSSFRVSSLGTGFFSEIAQIAHNKVLIAAGVSMAIGQFSKPFTSVFLYGKEFDIKTVVQAGGFPSSHSSATVAGATLLGLERGFSDPIFGLAVVYAGLVMYDAQGVRREVGIHARTLNKLLLQIHANSLLSKDSNGLINSQQGLSKPPKVDGLLEKSLGSQETTSLEQQQANASVSVKFGSKIRQSDEEILSSCFSEDAKEISKLVADGLLPLKESIGHTEVEVIAGALLGFLVALAVNTFMLSWQCRPAPDFSLCLFLIPERVQMEEQFKTLIVLSHYLEFWDEAAKSCHIVEAVPGFEQAIQSYAIHVLSLTYQKDSRTVLAELCLYSVVST